ncbi:MAG: Ig-like domain-containing protein [candidate division Zixibacteria bacterium]
MRKIFPICSALLALVLWFGCTEENVDLGTIPEEPIYFIDSVSPADGATSVAVNYPIIITFLRVMDTATLIGDRFDLSGDAGYAFSRNKTQATIYPYNDLEYNTEYTVTIEAGIADSIGNVMDTDYEWSFTTGLGISFLESTYPVNGQTQIPLDAVITVTFASELNLATINNSTFYLDNNVTGTVTYSNRIARFTPSANLPADTTYTVTLTSDITDNTGMSLGSDYIWSFSTIFSDSIPPALVRVSPAEGEINVPANIPLSLIFNEEIDPESVNLQVFVSFGIEGVIRTEDSIVIFSPNQYLLNNQEYTVTFSGQVADKSGNTLYLNYSWSFTTGGGPEIVSVYPQPGTIGVPIDTTVWVTFTNDMDLSTINSSSFAVLDEDENLVSGIRTYSNKTATFVPAQPFLPNHTYKVILTMGVRDITNQPIPSDTVWTFTTEAAAAL